MKKKKNDHWSRRRYPLGDHAANPLVVKCAFFPVKNLEKQLIRRPLPGHTQPIPHGLPGSHTLLY